MTLEQLLQGFPTKPESDQGFEEKQILHEEKDRLDKLIAKECKQGWLVRSRSHAAEGEHGVILVRRKAPSNAPL